MADTHRFFRASPEVYEAIRLQLDTVWGHGPGTGTETCYSPTATLDHAGMAVLAVRCEFCEYSVAKEMIASLLGGSVIEELDRQTYLQELPQIPVH